MAGKKITELSSGSLGNLPLSGTTAVVYSGVTFQHNLSDLRNVLVDSGSHHFTGSQTISGDLTVSGSITAHEYILSSSITNVEIQNVSGSSFFGNDSGDTHNFIGSVSITGSLDVSENTVTSGFGHIKQHLTIGPSLIHHTGSEYEALHASTTSSINIAHFEGDTEYYSQINVKNVNSGNNSSTDIVATADNGTETNHFVNLGINSSTYNGGFVGRENDAYLLNVGKDLYIGTVGGSEHPSKLFLFGQNEWERPQITVSGSGQVSFNTCSCDPGYTYQFSGSAKLQHDLDVVGSTTSSYFTGSFIGDGSGLTGVTVSTPDNMATTGSNSFVGNQQITGSITIGSDNRLNLGPDGTYISLGEGSLILNDSTGYIQLNAQNSSNSNYGTLILNANNDESFFSVTDNGRIGADIRFTTSGSLNIYTDDNTATLLLNDIPYDAHLATTGSNTFVGDQVITGSVSIDGGLRINDYQISLGSDTQVDGYSVAIGAEAQADGYSVSIGAFTAKNNVTNNTLYTVAIGAFAQQNNNPGDQTGTGAIAIGTLAGDSNQGTNAVALGRYAGRNNQAARSIVINATGGDLENTTSDSFVVKPIRNSSGTSLLMYNSVSGEITYTSNNLVSGSEQISYIGITNTPTGFTYNDNEIGVNVDVFDFGDNKTIDMQNSSILMLGSTIDSIKQTYTSGNDTYTTTITQDGPYTKFHKVDVTEDMMTPGVLNTDEYDYKFDVNSLRYENPIVGSSFSVTNGTTSGNITISAGGGEPVDGQRNGGDVYLWGGPVASGGVGGNVVINSNSGDIFIGPLQNTNAVKIGGGDRNNGNSYAGGVPTYFYGNVTLESGTTLNLSGVTVNGVNYATIPQLLGEVSSLNDTIDALATTGSNTFIGDQTISGSLNISGSISVSTLEDGELIIGSNGIITATLGNITIEPFADLLLNGGNSTDEVVEGGDVVIRGGNGADEANGIISTAGDVTIVGGTGGSGSFDSGGDGGNVTIVGGDSLTETAGGIVSIYGGFGYTGNAGNVVIGTGGTSTWEFNLNAGELVAPLLTIDRGTFYLDTTTQDQKIFFGSTSNASYIGTSFGDFKLYNSGSNLGIESQNVNITGSLHISGGGTLNGDNIVSSNTIQKMETITSASYALITPVSGTLYIIID